MANERPKTNMEAPREDNVNLNETHPLDDVINESKATLEAATEKKKRGRKPGGTNKPKQTSPNKVNSQEIEQQADAQKEMIGEVLNMVPKALAVKTGCMELELSTDEKLYAGKECARALAYLLPMMNDRQAAFLSAGLAIATISFNKTLVYSMWKEKQNGNRLPEN